ncbi:DivIVA domain-containing protein [Micromonospora nigra]|uniref:DivIVA domain-containing protein n=1 Tax=Micromonospora nigra TaxID=145857 RepID=A0A1C6SGZ2_9ACTN|nr:DivIVA domain-containing protein [Micromonospora nigra]SCL28703.1 DivIVA domain-containing protein [Micromonospora nigra]
MAVYRSRHALSGHALTGPFLNGPLTPDRIAAVELPRTRLGRRGYEPDAVHALLERLAHELQHRARQLDLVRDENRRVKHALRTWQSERFEAAERVGFRSGARHSVQLPCN